MMNLFIYIIAEFGFCWVIGHSKITLPFRLAIANRGTLPADWVLLLIECPACLGFWIGLVTTVFSAWIIPNPWHWALPLFTTGANFFLGRITGLITTEGDPA